MSYLTCKDLMVGDWVGYLPSYIDEETGKIVSVGTTPVPVRLSYMCGYDIENGESVDILDFELYPVLLTDEILEKNGFKNCEFYGELTIGEWRIMCDCHNIAILHGDHADLDIPIDFVHELQHALKLCKIDKEIEL